MRIHRMRIQGIGPFAEAQEVDLERLNAAGLFLLDGPTGAGKSTILAALCFALYGTVPGGRSPESLVTTLRPPGAVVPEVLVELTVQGRRFQVIRSPRHERLKKRRTGTGATTPTPATVSLREHRDGVWTAPLIRADDVGRALADVLRLDAAQFMQVVLLPQGQFAEFLTAKSDDRQRLLRRLFGTQRFDGVEEHLKARSDALGAQAAADARVAENARAQLRDVVREELGADWAEPEPDPVDDAGLLRLTSARAAAALAGARAAQQEAADAERAARTELAALVRTGEDIAEAQGWSQREAAHRKAAEAAARDRAAVAAHDRAGHVVAAADRAERAATAAADTRVQADAAAERVLADPSAAGWVVSGAVGEGPSPETAEDGPAPGAVDPAGLRARLAAASPAALREACFRAERAVDEVTGALADRDAIARLEAEGAREADRVAALAAEDAAAQRDTEARTAGRAALQEAVEAGTTRAGARHEVEAQATAAADRLRAATVAADRGAEAEAARAAHEKAAGVQRTAAECRLGLLRARYEQAAAELAEGLEAGRPCAVCGATEHPAPAPRVGTAVTEADVARAEKALARADAALAEADAARTAAQDRWAQAREEAGGLDVAAAQEALARAVARQEELAAAVKALAADRRRLARLEKEETEAATARAARATERARLEAAAQGRADRLAELRAGVRAAQAEAPDLDARAEQVRTARDLVVALEAAATARRREEAVLAAAGQAREEALAEHRFADVDAARAARMASDEAVVRAERITGWDAEAARLAELAEAPGVVRGRRLLAAGTPAPTEEAVQAARERVDRAETATAEATAALGSRRSLVASVERQSAVLRDVLERSAGLLEDHERVTGLLALVRGAGENRLKMPLASYVLAGRLEEVAAAASERLRAMTDDRYSIEHSDAVGGRGTKGLELVVRDHYVDETRHPSTLSGGETFMASLALALGLADTVQAEAGGVELDTLFVDEGFGSLDADTLDEVLDVVDGLRSGGRTVGLVSHVERMKQEIPVRLAVTKAREGSTLAVHDGA